MATSRIDARLLSAAEYVRAGAVFADIGTDHGYLPVFLLKKGIIERAVLTDINEHPLDSARESVRAEALSDRVDFHLTDGALGLEGLGVTDFAVCGMGGELIARIIEAPAIRTEGVRLITQPMTRPEALRRALDSLGFRTLEERYTESLGRFYLTILSEYDGKKRESDEFSAALGLCTPRESDISAYLGYMKARLASFERAYQGRLASGEEDGALREIILSIRAEIEKYS